MIDIDNTQTRLVTINLWIIILKSMQILTYEL